MKENKYDDSVFFEQYSHMPRSEQGLSAAGEWPALKALLPELAGKRVLDLGCIAGTRPSMARPVCLGRTFPNACWNAPAP